MESDRRLVEDVERAGEGVPDRRPELHALRLAPGERAHVARERQVREPDLDESRDAVRDVLDQMPAPRALVRGQVERPEEPEELGERQLGHLGDRLAPEAHRERGRIQARAAARSARRVAAVARQEDADVHLVALLLEVREEADDAVPRALPFPHDPPLLRGQVLPGNVAADAVLPARALEVGVRALVRGGVERRDRALVERLLRIGDHLQLVDADEASEALAGGARAARRVEGEVRGRRVLVPAAARAAREAAQIAPLHAAVRVPREEDAAAERERGLE